MSDSATPWTVARQATPLSMGFSSHEYWSGLPCPSPGDLSVPGMEPASLYSFDSNLGVSKWTAQCLWSWGHFCRDRVRPENWALCSFRRVVFPPLASPHPKPLLDSQLCRGCGGHHSPPRTCNPHDHLQLFPPGLVTNGRAARIPWFPSPLLPTVGK